MNHTDIATLTRTEFFRTPKIREITLQRTPYQVFSMDELFLALVDAKEDQFLDIHFPIMPEASPEGIPYEDAQNFMKRGPLLMVRRPQTVRDAVPESTGLEGRLEEKKRPLDFRREAFERLKQSNGIPYCGYTWLGLRGGDRIHRVCHPSYDIEGAKLVAWSDLSSSMEDKIEVKEYETTRDVEDKGGKFMLVIPSRSTRSKHPVTLEFVPVGNDSSQYAVVWNLKARHDCMLTTSSFNFRWVGGEFTLDPHISSGYLHEARRKWAHGEKMPLELNPFLVPTQFLVEEVYNKLYYASVVRLPGKRARQLNDAEMNIVLFEVAKRMKYDELFYASGPKLHEYNWLKHRQVA